MHALKKIFRDFPISDCSSPRLKTEPYPQTPKSETYMASIYLSRSDSQPLLEAESCYWVYPHGKQKTVPLSYTRRPLKENAFYVDSTRPNRWKTCDSNRFSPQIFRTIVLLRKPSMRPRVPAPLEQH